MNTSPVFITVKTWRNHPVFGANGWLLVEISVSLYIQVIDYQSLNVCSIFNERAKIPHDKVQYVTLEQEKNVNLPL